MIFFYDNLHPKIIKFGKLVPIDKESSNFDKIGRNGGPTASLNKMLDGVVTRLS